MAALQVVSEAIDLLGLRDALCISRERMARLLDVSWKTVGRIEIAAAREGGSRLPASAGAVARLAQIQQIVELGLTVYTPEGFERRRRTEGVPHYDEDWQGLVQVVQGLAAAGLPAEELALRYAPDGAPTH